MASKKKKPKGLFNGKDIVSGSFTIQRGILTVIAFDAKGGKHQVKTELKRRKNKVVIFSIS